MNRKQSTKLTRFGILVVILSVAILSPTHSLEFGTLNNEDETSFYLDTNDHHGYHGLINEDETNVVVTPTIKVGGKELVCGFAIINHHRKNRDEFPFEILVDDQNAGTAKLRVIRRLDCEEKKKLPVQRSGHFMFRIIFRKCWSSCFGPGCE